MPIEKIFSSFQISAAGLNANRRWMDAIAENLANAQTTRTDQGGPYKRKITSFAEVQKQVAVQGKGHEFKLPMALTEGTHLSTMDNGMDSETNGQVEANVSEDNASPRLVYDPDHPDANSEGYVAYPAVEVANEMVDLITASRAYEANVTVLNAAKSMMKKALEI
ncbi:MAG: flagellar basal body rod protein FlgC [bacterium]|nr:flagellar basal body rod protein FlgC [bacterium]